MAVSKIQCSGCGAILKSSAGLPAGKRVKCPKCGVAFLIPEGEAESKIADPQADNPQPNPSERPLGNAPGSPMSLAGGLRSGDPDRADPLAPRPRRRRRKKATSEDLEKAAIKKRLLIVLPILGVLALGTGLTVFALTRGISGKKKPNDNNEMVTEENFEKLKPGEALAEAEALLGEAAALKSDEVADAFSDAAQASAKIMGMGPGLRVNRKSQKDDIQGMEKTYTILSWVRWRNGTANIFAGIRKADDGSSQLAVIAFLDYDVEARNFGGGWKMMPISIEISNLGGRISVGKPLPQGTPANIDQVRPGLSEADVRDLLGLPSSIDSKPIATGASTAGETSRARTLWRYYDERSHCLPPLAFAASIVGVAGFPLEAGPVIVLCNLKTRMAAYEIEFEGGRVVEKKFHRLP
ncbi:MAG TPA: hypothetical protein VK395_11345 [Gemmataceae bacterium]|nr:hypothetical protein [Gemmataceae bacterium]